MWFFKLLKKCICLFNLFLFNYYYSASFIICFIYFNTSKWKFRLVLWHFVNIIIKIKLYCRLVCVYQTRAYLAFFYAITLLHTHLFDVPTEWLSKLPPLRDTKVTVVSFTAVCLFCSHTQNTEVFVQPRDTTTV